MKQINLDTADVVLNKVGHPEFVVSIDVSGHQFVVIIEIAISLDVEKMFSPLRVELVCVLLHDAEFAGVVLYTLLNHKCM